MRRREFLALSGAAAFWPSPVSGQHTRARLRIGFLNGQSAAQFSHLLAAFRQGLAEGGIKEGQDAELIFRWADGRVDQLSALAADLIDQRVDLIVATGGAHLAAKRATERIPVVFTTPGEPVKEGLVHDVSRPGGNATGVSVFTTNLEAKRVQLLHEMIPKAKVIAVLIDKNFAGGHELQLLEVEAASRAIDVRIEVLNASTEIELARVFGALKSLSSDAVSVVGNPFFNSQRNRIVQLAEEYRIPAIYELREFVTAGGLMSYGPSITNVYRQVGIYTARILLGERASELPVLQPTKFDLLINLVCAKKLGLSVSSSLLARADEVIE